MRNFIFFWTVILSWAPSSSTANNAYSSSTVQYNQINSPNWPGTGEWLALSRSLSTFAVLYGPFFPEDYEDQCLDEDDIDPTDPLQVATAGEGICMQYPSCRNEFCLADSKDQGNNLPSYVLMAKTEEDISKGIQFANFHKIPVTVKSSGHSLSGASTGGNSLLIWLAKFPVDNTIKTGYMDSCQDPSTANDVIGVNAGQNFKSIAEAVGDSYHFVSPSEWTVSAAGGFVQGGGISYTSRQYGLGVDNVVDFRVVLPNGSLVIADRCTNTDLFWALRGGGGGTFGVVTHMNYKLHPATPIVRFQFNLGNYSNNSTVVSNFLKYWAGTAPNLESRWGGRFTWFGLDLFFTGAQFGAQMTFLNDFSSWLRGFPALESGFFNKTTVYTSWSRVLPDLSEASGQEYVPETSFSRLVPLRFAEGDVLRSYQLLETLAVSRSMGYTNFLMGKNINLVRDNETSVHPAMRKSLFLITANQFGNDKLLSVLPNNVTGVSKNHVGPLEPNWRKSIWGEQYERLLSIKNMIDPTKVLSCYQSVGYSGEEVDVYNVENRTSPTPSPPGRIEFTSNGGVAIITGFKAMTMIATVTLNIVYLLW